MIIFGTANFNENCNNSTDFPDLVVCSNNAGGVETTFSGYTTGEVYHLQFDFFAWESTDCYYIDGSGCVDGAGMDIKENKEILEKDKNVKVNIKR